MKAEVLKIVAQNLLVNDDTLLHVSIVEGIERVESAFCDDVMKKDETSKDCACVDQANASDVAHALNIPNIRSIHCKSF